MGEKKEPSTIYVTGDVIIDQNIYYSGSTSTSTENATHMDESVGGAALIARLLENVSEADKNSDCKLISSDLVSAPREHCNVSNSFGLWRLIKKDKKPKTKKTIWRMSEPLGYGTCVYLCKDKCTTKQSTQAKFTDNADVLVIDAGGNCIDHNKDQWPEQITENAKGSIPKWVVLKKAAPVMNGPLLNHLSNNYQDQLVIITSAEDLRMESIGISKGVSWDRTAQNLVFELNRNAAIKGLLKCQHLVIAIGTAGALWVKNACSAERSYHLIFNKESMEGQWKEEHDGYVPGNMSCLLASVAYNLSQDHFDTKSIKSALSAMRYLQLNGHGASDEKTPSFPEGGIAKKIISDAEDDYGILEVPKWVLEDKTDKNNLMLDILESLYISDVGDNEEKRQPFYHRAQDVAISGINILDNAPRARFGKLLTVDRSESESLRIIRRLILDYERSGPQKKPLSLAVFGPPGAGKSFGVVQIVKGILNKAPIVEFNLSQFSGVDDLIGALHQVRDKVLGGVTPVIFWDEFDSKQFMWLQYLLAPMQDGKFQEGQVTHPIGKCIFIFAGGTSYTMDNFGKSSDKSMAEKFKLVKGPDFQSRLSGYLNVLGPNRRQYFDDAKCRWEEDDKDLCFPLRRAVLLRAMTGCYDDDDVLKIESGVLTALLETKKYKHGARSMEKIVNELTRNNSETICRSDLPSFELLDLHVDAEKFMEIVTRDRDYMANLDLLAPAIHEYWRKRYSDPKSTSGYNRDFYDLSEEEKQVNYAAAERIPKVLAKVGFSLEPKASEIEALNVDQYNGVIDKNLELLAEEEHKGWMQNSLDTGWVYGKESDKPNKIHNCLVEYNKLTEEEKDKDRDSVSHFSEMIDKAGYKVVRRT